MRLFSWPNAISLLRFPLAVLFVLAESVVVRSAIVIVAGCSDWIDGWLARRAGARTRSGELLDPIADKTFVLAALVGFVRTGQLGVFELVFLLLRDLYVTAAFLVAGLFGLRIRFTARAAGKLVTTLQIVAVLVLLLIPQWAGPLVVVTGMAGAVAIVDYTRAGLRSLRRGDGEA